MTPSRDDKRRLGASTRAIHEPVSGAEGEMGGLPVAQPLATSLGGVETLVSRPATSSHRMLSAAARDVLGITEGTVRFSVGLEDPEDLLADIGQALDLARGRVS